MKELKNKILLEIKCLMMESIIRIQTNVIRLITTVFSAHVFITAFILNLTRAFKANSIDFEDLQISRKSSSVLIKDFNF